MIDALARYDGFVSAQRLHAEMRLAGSRVGISTVYKTLNTLCVENLADWVIDPRDGVLFRLRGEQGRDDYVRCRQCGRAQAISLDLDDQLRRVLQGSLFRELSYMLDVTGRCATCTEQR